MDTSDPSDLSSFWQSPYWKTILQESHQASDVIIFCHEGKDLLIEIRTIGFAMSGAFSLGVDPEKYSTSFLTAAREFLLTKKVIFWQIEYYSLNLPEKYLSETSATYGRHFLEPWTQIIDTRYSLEDILSAMHEKGRYNLRYAEKHGVVTEWVTPVKENIDIWMSLLHETTERDGFHENPRAYYEVFLQTLDAQKIGGLLFARCEGRVIAAGIFVYYNHTGIYYYGASTSDPKYRKLMASSLIQWEAIQKAKERGCHYYDFLGVAPPDAVDHHLAGVTRFKERFSSTKKCIGPKKLYVLNPGKYRMYQCIRYVKRIFSSR